MGANFVTYTFLVLVACLAFASAVPTAEGANGVTYTGIYKHEIEGFVSIRYALDTGGPNRFKPPQPYIPSAGSVIDASSFDSPCPQDRDKPAEAKFQLQLTAITDITEDCLKLNVWRPNGTQAGDNLPVLFHIYGGGTLLSEVFTCERF